MDSWVQSHQHIVRMICDIPEDSVTKIAGLVLFHYLPFLMNTKFPCGHEIVKSFRLLWSWAPKIRENPQRSRMLCEVVNGRLSACNSCPLRLQVNSGVDRIEESGPPITSASWLHCVFHCRTWTTTPNQLALGFEMKSLVFTSLEYTPHSLFCLLTQHYFSPGKFLLNSQGSRVTYPADPYLITPLCLTKLTFLSSSVAAFSSHTNGL